jgi:hypothetical protein
MVAGGGESGSAWSINLGFARGPGESGGARLCICAGERPERAEPGVYAFKFRKRYDMSVQISECFFFSGTNQTDEEDMCMLPAVECHELLESSGKIYTDQMLISRQDQVMKQNTVVGGTILQTVLGLTS